MNLKKYSPLSFDGFIHIFCVKVFKCRLAAYIEMHKTVTAVTRTMLDKFGQSAFSIMTCHLFRKHVLSGLLKSN